MDYKYFLICALFYFGFVTAQEQDSCIQHESQNMLTCSMNLLQAMGLNTGSSSGDPPQIDLVNGLCGPEGRQAINCTNQVLNRCAPLKQQAYSSFESIPPEALGGIDLSKIFESGQMDKVCAQISSGGAGCALTAMSKVMGCYQSLITSMGIDMGGNGTQTNIFHSLSSASIFLCSENGKTTIACFKEAIDMCKDLKKQMEEQQKQGGPNIEEEFMKFNTWRDQNCNTAKYATFESQRTCVDGAMKSPEFEQCAMTVPKPNEKGIFPCGSVEKMKMCLDSTVGEKCSKDAAKVSLNTVTTLIKTPDNCPTDGASAVQVSMLTGLTAVAVLFAVL